MPGNLYGVSQPGYNGEALIASSDVSCPAGTETLILTTTTALIAPASGNWWLVLWGTLGFTFGASAPSALVIAARVHGGSDYDALSVNPGTLVNSASIVYPMNLMSLPSDTALFPNGEIIEVTANPTGQAVTFNHTGSRVIAHMFRGVDA